MTFKNTAFMLHVNKYFRYVGIWCDALYWKKSEKSKQFDDVWLRMSQMCTTIGKFACTIATLCLTCIHVHMQWFYSAITENKSNNYREWCCVNLILLTLLQVIPQPRRTLPYRGLTILPTVWNYFIFFLANQVWRNNCFYWKQL